MNIIQSSGPSFRNFQELAKTSETVSLKGGELKSTSDNSAKFGFFGRAVQWLKSILDTSSGKVNSDTRAAFSTAVEKFLGKYGAESALRLGGFDSGSKKPLTAREVKIVSEHVDRIIKFSNEVRSLKLALLKSEKFSEKVYEIVNDNVFNKGEELSGVNLKASNIADEKVRSAKVALEAKRQEVSAYMKS